MNFYTNVPLVRLGIFIKKNHKTLWISADGTHTRSIYLNDIRRYFQVKIIQIHRVICRLKNLSSRLARSNHADYLNWENRNLLIALS